MQLILDNKVGGVADSVLLPDDLQLGTGSWGRRRCFMVWWDIESQQKYSNAEEDGYDPTKQAANRANTPTQQTVHLSALLRARFFRLLPTGRG